MGGIKWQRRLRIIDLSVIAVRLARTMSAPSCSSPSTAGWGCPTRAAHSCFPSPRQLSNSLCCRHTGVARCRFGLARRERRAIKVACASGLSADVAGALVQNWSQMLATASPAPLKPVITLLASDIASTVSFHPTTQGLSRLLVGDQLPCPTALTKASLPFFSCSCRVVCLHFTWRLPQAFYAPYCS